MPTVILFISLSTSLRKGPDIKPVCCVACFKHAKEAPCCHSEGANHSHTQSCQPSNSDPCFFAKVHIQTICSIMCRHCNCTRHSSTDSADSVDSVTRLTR